MLHGISSCRSPQAGTSALRAPPQAPPKPPQHMLRKAGSARLRARYTHQKVVHPGSPSAAAAASSALGPVAAQKQQMQLPPTPALWPP
eukprot:scaffold80875_cov20-Tisochrysis_lutea.AAC.3